MRDILFRGISSDNYNITPEGEWIYGYMMGENKILGKCQGVYYDSWQFVKSNTVSQFTGAIDKNGNKVFEGDFIKIDKDDVLRVVEWCNEDCSYKLKSNNAGETLSLRKDACVYEIIGNRWQRIVNSADKG